MTVWFTIQHLSLARARIMAKYVSPWRKFMRKGDSMNNGKLWPFTTVSEINTSWKTELCLCLCGYLTAFAIKVINDSSAH